jgi:uncharacterized membrane protein YcaP (DUF421 family)
MRKHRSTHSDVEQAVRGAGYGGLDPIAPVALETDGSFSVNPSRSRRRWQPHPAGSSLGVHTPVE